MEGKILLVDDSDSRRRKKEPRVGIFWVVDGKLVIDSTSLSAAEPYGDHLTHPRSHMEVWMLLQQNGSVPTDFEYEELPRGRVTYHAKTQRFTLLADKCILRDKSIVGKIMSALCLPRRTRTGTDQHYKCSDCLQGN